MALTHVTEHVVTIASVPHAVRCAVDFRVLHSNATRARTVHRLARPPVREVMTDLQIHAFVHHWSVAFSHRYLTLRRCRPDVMLEDSQVVETDPEVDARLACNTRSFASRKHDNVRSSKNCFSLLNTVTSSAFMILQLASASVHEEAVRIPEKH